MPQNSVFDQSIPVLTEVFSDQPVVPPPAEAGGAPAAPVRDDVNAHLEARAINDWSGPEWNLLERRLSERILQQLQGRVDIVLEQGLRESMEEVLKSAVAGLAEEIRHGLQDSIERIVVRAVAQEVSHLKTLKG